jgi:hypothetical protein
MTRWPLTLGGLLVCGCNSTGVGNPPLTDLGTQALAITVDEQEAPAETSEPAPSKDVSLLKHTQLTSAALLFSEIRFLACDGSVRSEPGPFVVDLVKNSVSPELPSIQWPDSGLCGIDAVFGVAAKPDFLAGYSIVLVGTRPEKGAFIARVAMSGTLPLRPRGEKSWQPSEHVWLWALRPRHWFAEEELEDTDASETPPAASSSEPSPAELDAGAGRNNARPEAGPLLLPLTVTPERHVHLYTALKERLGIHTTLHVDENDSLTLDPEERTGKAFIGRGKGIIP